MKHFRSVVSLLLVFVLCFGMIPCAFADEITTPAVPQPSEGSASEAVPPNTDQTPPPEESAAPPEESTEPPSEEATEPMEEEPTDETTLPEELDDLDSDDRLLGAEAYASTQKSIMLFDFADNGDYTTRLNYQVSCTYKPNGSGTTRTAYVKNMGWHFARYGGVAHADEPLYCIEPWRNYGASTSGNSVDRDVTLNGSGSSTGSNVWYSLPSARREAIGLILLYSNQQWNHSVSVTTTKKDSNPNVPLRVATQILIYEIVCGLRDPNSFKRNSTNECGTSGDVFYNAASASVSGFSSCYNSLVSAIQSAKKIPSFCGSSSSNAPTIQLSGDTGSAYDSNGVLSAFSFSNGNGARFSKSGNTLNITKTGDISESTVFTATRYLPSASNSSYNIWYMSGSSYQTTISLYNAGSSGLNAYFKIKAPSLGNISLTKTTEDGQNLSGWKFGIYSDSSCTNLISGPYTTNSSGKLSITKCNTGSVMLVKETNTGENLGGWKIGLYYDADCTNPIQDSPFVTGADGTITVTGLQPGTLYAREIPTGDPYWEFDTEVKAVTIQVNQTASITFTNTQYGRIQIVKTTNTGSHLGGWTFQVRDSSGKTVGEFTTDESGYAITGNLPLGRYTVMELPTEDVYWIGELGFHTVLVTGGKDAVDTWLNKEQGIGWFYKKTNTGENVEGWKITIYSDPACTQEVGTVTTNEEGRGGYYLDPGIYYAKETGDEYGRFEDEYWMVDESVQKVEILPHQDTEITFTNVQYGKLKILKTMEDGTTAAGWQFRVTDAAGAEVEGSPFVTSEDGTILETLLPGEYTVEEILPEDSLYVCKSENPQKVSVVQGQIAEVTFVNGIHTGRIAVQKVDTQRNPLSGATFLLEWSEDGALWWPVTFSETAIKGGCANADLVDGMLTSGEDGILEWTNLHPGLQYRLTEVKAPNGYKLLPDVAFSGELPADDLTVALTVVNARTFTMPETGSASGTILKVLSLLAALGCLGLLLARKRRP
jgi:Cna protein B-type domain protein